MSRVRIAVEWPFGGITEYFAFVDFKKNMKLYLQAVGKLYLVSTILYNARVCLYGSTTSWTAHIRGLLGIRITKYDTFNIVFHKFPTCKQNNFYIVHTSEHHVM